MTPDIHQIQTENAVLDIIKRRLVGIHPGIEVRDWNDYHGPDGDSVTYCFPVSTDTATGVMEVRVRMVRT